MEKKPGEFADGTIASSELHADGVTADGERFGRLGSSATSAETGSGVELLGKLFPHSSKAELERTLRRCSGNVVQSIEQLLQFTNAAATTSVGIGKSNGVARHMQATSSPEAEPHLARGHSQLIPYGHLHNGGSQHSHHQPSAQSRLAHQSNVAVDVPLGSTFSPFSYHHQSPYFRPGSTAVVGPSGGPFPLMPPASAGAPNLPIGMQPGGAAASAVHQAAAAAVEAMRHAVYGVPGCPAAQHPSSSSSVGGHPCLPPSTHPTSSCTSSSPSSSMHYGGRAGLPPAAGAAPGGAPFGLPYSPAAAAAAFLPTFAGLRYNYGAVMAAAAMFHASAVAAAASAATNGGMPSETAARGTDRTSRPRPSGPGRRGP